MVSHSQAPVRRAPHWNRSTATAPSALVLALALALGGCASSAPRSGAGTAATATPASATSTAQAQARAALQKATTQVISAERAFATTMTQRNFKAFLTFLSPDAIFFSGSSVERGPAQIAEQWAPYFRGQRAPFAWQPDDVQVLSDGKLALSTGPLLQGGRVVGRFNSVWRLEAPGVWHVILDKGEEVCSAPPPTTNSNGEQFFQPPQAPGH
ncbi:MAG TPA: nuclear transport factor 2 family protein [Steroidobacteraceae bacterium]|jgi:ketosteroid isomerase-like protein|nr:nuclear transport factor 2 family protein [Steroidobacteraceae bacterium]